MLTANQLGLWLQRHEFWGGNGSFEERSREGEGRCEGENRNRARMFAWLQWTTLGRSQRLLRGAWRGARLRPPALGALAQGGEARERPATPWVVCRWRGRGGLAPVRFSRAAAQLQTLACTQRGFAPRRPECLGLCPGPRFLFLISTWTGAELWAAESVMVRSDWPLLQKAHPCLQRAHRGPRTRCSPAPFPTRAHERGPD